MDSGGTAQGCRRRRADVRQGGKRSDVKSISIPSKNMMNIYIVNGNGKAIFIGAFLERTRSNLYQSTSLKKFFKKF